MTTPRGLRNNNPGNLRHSVTTRWYGEAAQQADKEFVTFTDPVFGIRAMARVLFGYQKRHGLRTVRQFIHRWAPPVENNTDAYADAVGRALMTGVDDELPPLGPQTYDLGVPRIPWQMVRLVEAIIKHENGRQPYDKNLIVAGIHLAASEHGA